MVEPKVLLDVYDYLVLATVLAISTGIGVFFALVDGRQKTVKEYLLADKQMPILPVTVSMVVSCLSAIGLLGTPAEIYIHGIQYVIFCFAILLMIPVAGFLYYPVFYTLNLTSAYEYLELRFKSKPLRIVGTVMYTIQMLMYMSVVLYAPSLALNAVTGFNVWASVFTIGSICTLYITIGGMKAVIWTDVFQGLIMMVGVLVPLATGCVQFDGLANVWRIAEEGQRTVLFDFDPSPTTRHTFWSLSIGGCYTLLVIYGVNQALIQRALACPRIRNAQLSLLFNGVGLSLFFILISLCGLVVYAQYRFCDPVGSQQILSVDQIFPLYVMETLSHIPGLSGFFVASIFSGSLSTLSSGLNSLAAVTGQDIVQGNLFTNIGQRQATTLSKVLSCSYGIIVMLLTVVASQLGTIQQAAFSLFGLIGGPVLGLFTLGLFFPWANWKGALAGFFTSLVLQLWMGLGANIHKPHVDKPPVSMAGCMLNITTESNITATMDYISPTLNDLMNDITLSGTTQHESALMQLYSISYMWYSLIGTITVCVVGLVISFFTGPMRSEELDPKLISPPLKIFWEKLGLYRWPINQEETDENNLDLTTGVPPLKLT